MNEESPAHTNSSVEVSEEVRGHGVLRTSSRASLRGGLFLITLWACTLVRVDGPKGGGLHTAIPECNADAAPTVWRAASGGRGAASYYLGSGRAYAGENGEWAGVDARTPVDEWHAPGRQVAGAEGACTSIASESGRHRGAVDTATKPLRAVTRREQTGSGRVERSNAAHEWRRTLGSAGWLADSRQRAASAWVAAAAPRPRPSRARPHWPRAPAGSGGGAPAVEGVPSCGGGETLELFFISQHNQ